MNLPRGIRNNNPGNIRRTDIEWEGKVKGGDSVFEVFSRPWWGIRALAKLLLNYQSKHDLMTPAELISRWAPGHENPTDIYVQHIAQRLGVTAHQAIFVEKYDTAYKLAAAIIEFENGRNPYTWEIQTGIILAGIEPAQPEYK